jgi:hypothetical protein
VVAAVAADVLALVRAQVVLALARVVVDNFIVCINTFRIDTKWIRVSGKDSSLAKGSGQISNLARLNKTSPPQVYTILNTAPKVKAVGFTFVLTEIWQQARDMACSWSMPTE